MVHRGVDVLNPTRSNREVYYYYYRGYKTRILFLTEKQDSKDSKSWNVISVIREGKIL